VTGAKKVDLREIMRWSAAENKSPEFEGIRGKFLEVIRKRKGS